MGRKPSKDRYVLTEDENERIFKEEITNEEYSGLRSASRPVAYFVGAQPGAGKTRVQRVLRARAEASADQASVVEIIGDNLRVYHPVYAHLLQEDDQLAAYFTDIDSGRWVEKAVAFSCEVHCFAIIEGTLRRADITLRTADTYRHNGFRVELHVPVVHEFQSRLYSIGRYLGQVNNIGYGRYTARSSHDVAYKALHRSVTRFARSKAFDLIALYEADLKPLLQVDQHTKNAIEAIVKCLRSERNSPKMRTNELLEQIAEYIVLAERYQKVQCLEDLYSLQGDIRKN